MKEKTSPYAIARENALGEWNKTYLEGLLKKADGNVTAAAKAAGLDRSNFRRLLKRFRLFTPTPPVVPKPITLWPKRNEGDNRDEGQLGSIEPT